MLLLISLNTPGSPDKADQHWLSNYQDDPFLFNFDGYRITRYRSPTPDHAEGGQLITTAELNAKISSETPPLLINVQPLQWRQGVFLQQQPQPGIPGSRWLPNVGQGEPEQAWMDYFRDNLYQGTGGRKNLAIVLYCTADCWMSWNAVKRAYSWGYTELYWYKEGIDGWQEADLPETTLSPELFQANK
ncbi:rhodanese-like domain-containing protein [Amphritea japonica]|uniref:Sulfurtransferase n=1 Tax=Amphritea japonica ATCC BAA-1530 TaxID=1278309 RepID=A0A7R6P2Q1_9GAMM|nr:rhodanese-like domain-containing protein [Amphritea japonica]BBB25894.1 sulfurtransferase [Amphritea japonica ATCC BAA-1530]